MQGVHRYAGFAHALLASPASSTETHFGFKQIIVAGSSNVLASALNNKSAIVGVYTDGAGTHGFIQAGAGLTVLPQAYPCGKSDPLYPTEINRAGDVVGGAYTLRWLFKRVHEDHATRQLSRGLRSEW